MRRRELFFSFFFCFSFVAGRTQSQTMLTGKIVDSGGTNLPRCCVHVLGCEKRDSSDKDGVYQLYLAPGKYELELIRTGRATHRRKIEIPPVDFYEVDFVLASVH